MPTCPLCSNKILLSVNEKADQKVDQHIRSGCKLYLLKDEKSRTKAKIKKSKHCDQEHCQNLPRYDTIKCRKCQLQFCLTHRSHKCSKAPTKQPKTNSAATRLLMKLRGGHPGQDRKERAQAKLASAAKNKNKNKILRRTARKTPSGDPRLDERDRFYLEIQYPKKPYSSVVDMDSISMWFNKNHTIGRVLDSVCREAHIENRNNIPDQPKLQILHTRTKSTLPYDIPLHLLTGHLNQGDTIQVTTQPAISVS